MNTNLVFPKNDGTGDGSISIYGYMLNGFGVHTLRATDLKTGETATAKVTLKALTRTGATFTRTKKAPAAATLRVAGTLMFFDGSGFPTASLRHPLTLQRKTGGRWMAIRTTWTLNGVANWSLKVRGKATYRVCHAADTQSTASCTSARTL